MKIVAYLRSIGLVLLILFFISSFSRNLMEYWRSVAFYKDHLTAYEEELQLNRQLKAELITSESNYEVEKIIRNKLNLLKDGEEMVIVQVPTPIVLLTPTPQPVLQQWGEVFLGGF